MYTLGVAGAVAFTPSVSASAEMLVYVTTNSTGTDIFFDVDSIRIQGTKVTAWETREHKNDKTVTYRTSKARYSYYCDSDEAAWLVVVRYDKSGKVVETVELKEYETEKTTIVPGSIREAMQKIACAAVNK